MYILLIPKPQTNGETLNLSAQRSPGGSSESLYYVTYVRIVWGYSIQSPEGKKHYLMGGCVDTEHGFLYWEIKYPVQNAASSGLE